MDLGQKPINAREAVPVIIPIDKWEEKGDPKHLVKAFKFRRGADKVRFVSELVEYEEDVQHHGDIHISEDTVTIVLITKNTEQITERDKEYALFADSLFKDIAYTP